MKGPIAASGRGWNPVLLLGLAGLLLAGLLNILLDRRGVVAEEYAASGFGSAPAEADVPGTTRAWSPALAPNPSYGSTVERVVALCEAAGIDSFRYEASTRERQVMPPEMAAWARAHLRDEADADRDGIRREDPGRAEPPAWYGWHEIDLSCWSDYESIERFLNDIRGADPPLSIGSLTIEADGPLLRMGITLKSAAQEY